MLQTEREDSSWVSLLTRYRDPFDEVGVERNLCCGIARLATRVTRYSQKIATCPDAVERRRLTSLRFRELSVEESLSCCHNYNSLL